MPITAPSPPALPAMLLWNPFFFAWSLAFGASATMLAAWNGAGFTPPTPIPTDHAGSGDLQLPVPETFQKDKDRELFA